MLIRKLHRIVGVSFAVFFCITAFAGAILLFRHKGWYSTEMWRFLKDIHNWEQLAVYVNINWLGIVLAAALIFMAITGLTLFFQPILRKRRKRKG